MIHGLVNSGNLRQLRTIMVLTSKIADDSGLPADIDAARIAKAEYEEQVSKQAVVDDVAKEGEGAVVSLPSIAHPQGPGQG
jgi:hypothetical protein